MGIVLLFVFAVALIAGPIGAGLAGHPLGAVSQSLMTVTGIGLAILSGFAMIITRLYVKTKASEAFVKTGMGGLKVVKDGGAYVIPIIHQVVRISLQTFRLEVLRQGANDALITEDKLRADIKAEFFVRVVPDKDSIEAAARSFGDNMNDLDYVRSIIEDKLVSALRTVAATKSLEQLNTERDDFMKRVSGIITPDLAHNGLTLETATISKLDQTDPKTLRDNNIFDAQGLRTIAEITQAQLTMRNQLERSGEQARAEQDLATKKSLLEFAQQQAEATAKQRAAIQQINATQDQLAKETEITAQRAVELALVEKSKQIAVAGQQQEQATEVATRAKQQAIAEAEQGRVGAEAALATAEALREKETQAIETVRITATANRDKDQRVIKAQAEAEAGFVTQQRVADGKAYQVQKDAEARKDAAAADAEAITKKAEAESQAKIAQANGEKAIAMVPVQVDAERVSVEKRRIEDVLVPELRAREEHGERAQDFQLAQLRITKTAEVNIATAHATATLMSSVQAQVRLFGSPKDLADMTQSWMSGMQMSGMAEGLLEGAGDKTTAGAKTLLADLKRIVETATRKPVDAESAIEAAPVPAIAQPAAAPLPATPTATTVSAPGKSTPPPPVPAKK